MFVHPISLLVGWMLDWLFGDPALLPHPIVWFGRMISFGEKRLNHGQYRKMKGALMAIFLIVFVFAVAWLIRWWLIRQALWLVWVFDAVVVFYCLAGTTLIKEVRAVFVALDRSLEEGRAQVARIVGRDTSELSAQEVRKAALETLAENLSDGVIAPLFWLMLLGTPGMLAYKMVNTLDSMIGYHTLFWLMLLGTPGMLAYKMVNTLDSMIGYHTERYLHFGCWAARIDDVANYIPARLTAALMVIFTSSPFHHLAFIRKYGRNHASPNSGYPEAALASILDCQFGGPHKYFGEMFYKPFIGDHDRELSTADMKTAVRVNRTAEILMVIIVLAESWAILLLSR